MICSRSWLLGVGLFLFCLTARAADPPATPSTQSACPECLVRDPFFADEVWAKVGERTCLNCHNPTGDASASAFLLADAARNAEALERNRKAFIEMVAKKDGVSRLLAKASGSVKHGGGVVLKPGTTGYRILEKFVGRVGGADKSVVEPPGFVPGPYFTGVAMATPQRLLRRFTLSLAGRLPTTKEREAVEQHGMDAIGPILDGVMKEDAFYDRLKEGFNDIFLTLGYPGNADDALSYEHFEKTRHWYDKYDLSHIPEKDRQKAGWALAATYRKALLREPLELVAHLVRDDLPFTGVVTADYIMVSPYTARGYAVFEENKSKFKNPDDPFEYIPAKIKALKDRGGKVQPSATGFYPHAGILTTFQYLRRYPTTVTNRNRLRARMYYQHFLGVDVMALAPRVGDAAAVSKKYKVPTMEAAECVVCHKTVDPVAGLFRDYFNEEGHYGPRKEGWFIDMFGPGLEGTDLPSADGSRALQWLGAATAKDPRFAVAMVEHVYTILMGRRSLLAPQDIDDPLFTPKRRAYIEQRKAIHEIAEQFAKANFNLKVVFKSLIASPFYRADGLTEVATHPNRRAELDDIGLVHMLTPEQLERKIGAVFGKRWGRLADDGDNRFALLYGGIDSKEVTQRATDPSGAMGAIQRIMANDVACRNVAADFERPAGQRRLFPGIEPTVTPDGSPETEKRIRAAIVHLHGQILGRTLPADHADVTRAYELFAGIVTEARGKKGLNQRENYFCQVESEKRATEDPHYTIRAWRAVVTYLLRQDDFLYE
ncbi:hypothetical protein [Fimbriiglobus ruber]|uniref:DUF1592 domain-containing protein n=1 Tax=Fimbriiglobus ruber TaxID=1908690 RepID=A0A225DXS1_9BACT|nr:hypothetical protein [Fimbriiglobus ruber]OWK46340.1 hypothetical protein FRUB_00039 [Fimbriiglobus ruber]